jgi:hypothetical protein
MVAAQHPVTPTGSPLPTEAISTGTSIRALSWTTTTRSVLLPLTRRGGFFASDGELGLEFDSDETIDHFSTSWWTFFHDQVDRYNKNAGGVHGQIAIVTGLVGIDWAHTPATESHPVWALAINENNAVIQENTILSRWVFFVRNWGKGFCSSHNHVLILPNGKFTIKLDWAPGAHDLLAVTGAVRGGFGGNPFLSLNHPVDVTPVQNDGVYATFTLPSPGYEPFYEGEIDLRWNYPDTPVPPPPPHPQPCVIEHRCTEASVDDLVAELIGSRLTKREAARIAAQLNTPNWRDHRVRGRKFRLHRKGHPPAMPSRRPRSYSLADKRQRQRERKQRRLLCSTFGGAIAVFTSMCFVPSTTIKFDSRPAGETISNQYRRRGVTFGPATTGETEAPQIALVGRSATSGTRVLRLGRCFSPSCEFGMQWLLTARFARAQQRVGVFAGDFASAPAEVKLTAYDSRNTVLAQTQATVQAASGFRTPLVVRSHRRTIKRVVVASADEVGVDDFAFG